MTKTVLPFSACKNTTVNKRFTLIILCLLIFFFKNSLKIITIIESPFVCWNTLNEYMTNSEDPDEMPPNKIKIQDFAFLSCGPTNHISGSLYPTDGSMG